MHERDSTREPVPPVSLRIMRIRNAVETGFYRPGQVVSQRRIAEDLGLSVTPIREAVIELSAAGLIEEARARCLEARG